MHFGWYVNPETPGPEHDRATIKQVIRECELAEDLGFTALWITEHHFTGYNTYSDALVMTANLAARTARVKLGFAVAILSLHHPVRFAEQCSLLDQLSDGRLIVGVGSGFGGVEFDGFGVNYKERHARFDEAADLLFKVWAHEEGTLTFDSETYHGTINGRIIPRPVQEPLPLVARATVHAEFAEAWGAMGQPILYPPWGPEHLAAMAEAHYKGIEKAQVSQARKEEAKRWSPMLFTVHVAETDEEAERDFMPAAEQHMIAQRRANHYGTFNSLADLDPRWVQDWKDTKMVAGNPDTVAKRLREFGEKGVEHVMVWMNTGLLAPDKVERSMRLFSKEVMPQLEGVTGTMVPRAGFVPKDFDG